MTPACQRLFVLFALITAAVVGCGRAGSGASGKNVSHVRAVTALYFQANSKLGKNPANAEEFKQAVTSGNVDWSTLGVSGLDELLISDRDGKPLVILYGPPAKPGPLNVVAYEQEGLDGVRLVGMSNGQIQSADAATFAKLVPQPAAPQ